MIFPGTWLIVIGVLILVVVLVGAVADFLIGLRR